MELKDRISIIIKRNNLNASSFADTLQIQRSSMSHILSGRNKPSLDFIQKFIQKFPNEDVIWLITGITNNSHKDNLINEITPKENKAFTQDLPKSKQREITKIITFYNDSTFDLYVPNS